jgi:hypothetical protein
MRGYFPASKQLRRPRRGRLCQLADDPSARRRCRLGARADGIEEPRTRLAPAFLRPRGVVVDRGRGSHGVARHSADASRRANCFVAITPGVGHDSSLMSRGARAVGAGGPGRAGAPRARRRHVTRPAVRFRRSRRVRRARLHVSRRASPGTRARDRGAAVKHQFGARLRRPRRVRSRVPGRPRRAVVALELDQAHISS